MVSCTLPQPIEMGLSVKQAGIEIPDGETQIPKPFLNVYRTESPFQRGEGIFDSRSDTF